MRKKSLKECLVKICPKAYLWYWINIKARVDMKGKFKLIGFKDVVLVFRFTRPISEVLSALRFGLNIAKVCKSKIQFVFDHEWETDFMNSYQKDANQWEVCFNQPFNESLDEKVRKEQIIIAPTIELCKQPDLRNDKSRKKYYTKWNKIFNEYIGFNKRMQEKIHRDSSIILGLSGKIATVSLREEFRLFQDINPEVYAVHPRDPSINETINIVKNLMKEWGFEYIYLLAQYQETIDLFRETFGEQLIVYERLHQRIEQIDREWINGFTKMNPKEVKERYLKGLEKRGTDNFTNTQDYVEDVALASMTDFFIGSKSGASIMANIWNAGKYEKVFVFDDYNRSNLY